MDSTTTAYLLKFSIIFLLFISSSSSPPPSSTLSSSTFTAAATKSPNSIYKKYLKTACNSTTYPKICYSSLSSYISIIKTSDLNLCSTALNVSLTVAYNASSLVTLLSNRTGLSKAEAAVIKDCVEQIGDTIDELKQSFDAFGSLYLNNSDIRFQISNIQTWVSAALTNEDTCSDGVDETKVSSSVKNMLKKSMLNVARITSNALALINKLSL
ncbi:pectinesterase inhibitor 4-like [Mercurialis annua]|uniref:pectinesterase inhibitor 4-like n=1 Tax=Mercurialis annua TaxID=3986 RepID=UPI00215F5135|nr:pectinesterase inhibitor 4-like [Mercurialis annua]